MSVAGRIRVDIVTAYVMSGVWRFDVEDLMQQSTPKLSRL